MDHFALDNLATFCLVVTFLAGSKPLLRTGSVLGLLGILSGCGPKFVQLGENRQGYTREQGRNLGARLILTGGFDVSPLKNVAETFLGWPYLYGGTGPDGIDCSAFCQQVMRRTYGMELPRTAALQSNLGVPVFRFGLQPGDFVFFNAGPGYNADSITHVGIFMGNGKFINATTSGGVRYCSLDENYWSQRYQLARRFPNLKVLDSLRR